METHWYAIRVSYGRVLKFCAGLIEDGIESFVPMTRKKVVKNGQTVSITVPAISNLCFVRTTRNILEERMISMGERRYAHFIWNVHTRQPIIVPDKAMEDFIHICTVMSDETLYLKDITSKLHEGQRVRVIDGPFKGIEGTVLRVKRSRRVVVDFPDLLAVATNYIDPRNLEPLE
jgi:transcription antitermination factor NusG